MAAAVARKLAGKPNGAWAIQGDRISGWAIGSDREAPADVAVIVDDIQLCVLSAVLPRPDVARKHRLPSDRCGFDFKIPDHFINPNMHTVRLEVMPERVALEGSRARVAFTASSLLIDERVVPLAELSVAAPKDAPAKLTPPASRWLEPVVENFGQIADSAHAPLLRAMMKPLEILHEARADVARVPSVMLVRNGPVVALGRGMVREYVEMTPRIFQRWIVRAMREGRYEYVERPSLIVQRKGVDNYYHWMIEFLPKILASDWDGEERRAEVASFGSPFIESSIDYLGLSENVRAVHDTSALIFAEAYLPRFVNKGGPRDTRIDGYFCELHDRITARTSAPSTGRGRVIFVDRGDAGTRRLLNREALLAVLERHDIEPVLMTGRTIAEQAEIFAGADAIIGIHGAALTNLMFARKGTKVLEIIPAALVPRIRCYMDLSAVGGLGYSAYVEENEMLERENFNLDMARFTRCLEEFLEAARG